MAYRTSLQRLAFVAVVVLLGGCTTLDLNVPRTPSSALTVEESKTTALGQAWTAAAPADPALSAFRLLPYSLEACAARIAMIDAAEKTLDLQYYTIHNDNVGLFIVDRLVTAADRGVRVRILMDDLYAHGVEKGLAAFDAHPNIELRLFNPWTQRSGGLVRGCEYLFSSRLNRRMHNKLFIADGIVAVLGGRNLADEYFDLNAEFDFKDFDVAAVGPVVAGANHLFDEFWNGPDAIPVAGLKPKPDGDQMLLDGRDRLEKHREHMKTSAYADAVRNTPLFKQLKEHSVQWVFAPGQVLGTSPHETTRPKDSLPPNSLAAQLEDVFFAAKSELLVSSPYFVPGKKPTERFCGLVANGAEVRVLTNSLSATDVPLVHSGYSKYRSRLLKGGVELFELRHRRAHDVGKDDDERAYGSANVSLHAKTFVVDRRQVFIGSLNLDPRSVVINTEIGVLIDSPQLADSVANTITTVMGPTWSYRVVITPKGKLNWVCEDANGTEVRYDTDPDTSWWDRFKSGLLGLLPIEGQI